MGWPLRRPYRPPTADAAHDALDRTPAQAWDVAEAADAPIPRVAGAASPSKPKGPAPGGAPARATSPVSARSMIVPPQIGYYLHLHQSVTLICPPSSKALPHAAHLPFHPRKGHTPGLPRVALASFEPPPQTPGR